MLYSALSEIENPAMLRTPGVTPTFSFKENADGMPDNTSTNEFVYAIQAINLKTVKIGFSTDVNQRLASRDTEPIVKTYREWADEREGFIARMDEQAKLPDTAEVLELRKNLSTAREDADLYKLNFENLHREAATEVKRLQDTIQQLQQPRPLTLRERITGTVEAK